MPNLSKKNLRIIEEIEREDENPVFDADFESDEFGSGDDIEFEPDADADDFDGDDEFADFDDVADELDAEEGGEGDGEEAALEPLPDESEYEKKVPMPSDLTVGNVRDLLADMPDDAPFHVDVVFPDAESHFRKEGVDVHQTEDGTVGISISIGRGEVEDVQAAIEDPGDFPDEFGDEEDVEDFDMDDEGFPFDDDEGDEDAGSDDDSGEASDGEEDAGSDEDDEES